MNTIVDVDALSNAIDDAVDVFDVDVDVVVYCLLFVVLMDEN
jgi:hypothetical protein